jgi:oligopeptidase B
MRCTLNRTNRSDWSEFIGHRPQVLIETMDIFNRFFVITERIEGTTQLRIIDRAGNGEHYVDLPETVHLVNTGKNPEYESVQLRFHYSSLITPNSVYDYNMATRELTLLKRQEVIGGYDPAQYRSERLMVPAYDGVSVPVSLVYHKDTPIDGKAPLLLYGYGAYGISLDPYFSSVRLSLLDRGFLFAMAHVRGGEEMGRDWYEQGKMMLKKNSFTDFIACAEHLITIGYTDPSRLFAMGGSAGGLLIGTVLNLRPDLWKGAIAAVPFVDVLTTMLDESIPLTTGEFEEWGNPKAEDFYHFIKSYSPYDNVEEKNYPALLVTTGFHDSQVQYWEPAKWVARLRDRKTDRNPLLLHCKMDTGHGGASGRFRQLEEVALEYAFLIWMEQRGGAVANP